MNNRLEISTRVQPYNHFYIMITYSQTSAAFPITTQNGSTPTCQK